MGNFTTAFAYNLLEPTTLNSSKNLQWIWKLNTLPKIKYFLWLCYHQHLPSNLYLYKIKLITSDLCSVCNKGSEDVDSSNAA